MVKLSKSDIRLRKLGRNIFPLGFCEVCWTYSWAPVPKSHPHAQRLPAKSAKLTGHSYVVCRMCEAQREIKKLK